MSTNRDFLEETFSQMSKDALPQSRNLSFGALEQKIAEAARQKAPQSWAIAASLLLFVVLGVNAFAYQRALKTPKQNLLQKMELVNNYSIYDTDEQG